MKSHYENQAQTLTSGAVLSHGNDVADGQRQLERNDKRGEGCPERPRPLPVSLIRDHRSQSSKTANSHLDLVASDTYGKRVVFGTLLTMLGTLYGTLEVAPPILSEIDRLIRGSVIGNAAWKRLRRMSSCWQVSTESGWLWVCSAGERQARLAGALSRPSWADLVSSPKGLKIGDAKDGTSKTAILTESRDFVVVAEHPTHRSGLVTIAERINEIDDLVYVTVDPIKVGSFQLDLQFDNRLDFVDIAEVLPYELPVAMLANDPLTSNPRSFCSQ